MERESIYVETPVEGEIEELWERTQNPDGHARWDLRFTDITYLECEEGEPQRFTYRTRIGGIEVSGRGESVGERERDGETTSSLRFWSDDPKALITEGTGFWRYIEQDDHVRFLTEYNYETRYGLLGRLVDSVAFRPLLGWATAWSFDILRRWVEDDVPPEASIQRALVHAICRLSLALVWVYQGVVPKLLARHPQELALVRAGPLPDHLAPELLTALGVGELLFGLALLWFWRERRLFLVAAALPLVLTAGAIATMPSVVTGPFNPVVVTIAVVALGAAGYLVGEDVPTATRCLRSPPEDP